MTMHREEEILHWITDGTNGETLDAPSSEDRELKQLWQNWSDDLVQPTLSTDEKQELVRRFCATDPTTISKRQSPSLYQYATSVLAMSITLLMSVQLFSAGSEPTASAWPLAPFKDDIPWVDQLQAETESLRVALSETERRWLQAEPVRTGYLLTNVRRLEDSWANESL